MRYRPEETLAECPFACLKLQKTGYITLCTMRQSLKSGRYWLLSIIKRRLQIYHYQYYYSFFVHVREEIHFFFGNIYIIYFLKSIYVFQGTKNIHETSIKRQALCLTFGLQAEWVLTNTAWLRPRVLTYTQFELNRAVIRRFLYLFLSPFSLYFLAFSFSSRSQTLSLPSFRCLCTYLFPLYGLLFRLFSIYLLITLPSCFSYTLSYPLLSLPYVLLL